MATYEFTYKVPDQVYVDSWAEGKTATAKVKLDNPVITAFVDTFEPSMRIVGSTLEDGIDSEGAWRLSRGELPGTVYSPSSQVRAITIDASKSDTEAMAAWLCKRQVNGAMDSDEFPNPEYAEADVPVLSGSKKFQELQNPMPSDYWDLVAGNGADVDSVNFRFISKSDMTTGETATFQRREEVKFYYDKYDLGTAGESDAKAFLTACDEFLAKYKPVKPWMDDGTFLDNEELKPLKIPYSVTQAVKAVREDTDAMVETAVGNQMARLNATNGIDNVGTETTTDPMTLAEYIKRNGGLGKDHTDDYDIGVTYKFYTDL